MYSLVSIVEDVSWLDDCYDGPCSMFLFLFLCLLSHFPLLLSMIKYGGHILTAAVAGRVVGLPKHVKKMLIVGGRGVKVNVNCFYMVTPVIE